LSATAKIGRPQYGHGFIGDLTLMRSLLIPSAAPHPWWARYGGMVSGDGGADA